MYTIKLKSGNTLNNVYIINESDDTISFAYYMKSENETKVIKDFPKNRIISITK